MLQAKAIIQEWLSQVGLELKPEKTRIAHTLKEYEGNKPGFDFLGFIAGKTHLNYGSFYR